MKGCKNRGITLLELIITMAILLIVTSAIFSFFLSSNKSMNALEEKNTIQNEGEAAINRLSETTLNGSSIKAINGISFSEITGDNINITTLVINNIYSSVENQYKVENGKLFFKTSDKTSWELLSNYVQSLVITPIKNNVGATKGIKIVLILQYKDALKTFTNQIYFRNN